MTTQDSLNQLEEVLKKEKKFFKDNFSIVYPDTMIDDCKYIINNMKIPPEVYATMENEIELVYETKNGYIAISIDEDGYGIFIDVDNIESGWANTETAWDTVKWYNALTAMAENTEPKRKNLNNEKE